MAIGEGIEELAEEELLVDDVDVEAESIVEEAPLEDVEAPQEELPSDAEGTRDVGDVTELLSEDIVEMPAPKDQLQDTVPIPQHAAPAIDGADICTSLPSISNDSR